MQNNAPWNIERFDQEHTYGGRVVGITLRQCDYAAIARAGGTYGERVADPGELPAAVVRDPERAPAAVDVVTSQDSVSSNARKGLGFVPVYRAFIAWDETERRHRDGAGTRKPQYTLPAVTGAQEARRHLGAPRNPWRIAEDPLSADPGESNHFAGRFLATVTAVSARKSEMN